MKSVYVLGSLRNRNVPAVATRLRANGFEVFDDWHAAGYEADDKWRDYEQERGRSYAEALDGYSARHVFNYDRAHLMRCDVAVMVAPAGRSAHLELGYALGNGKPGFVLFDGEPERWDVMYLFATGVCFSIDELAKNLEAFR